MKKNLSIPLTVILGLILLSSITQGVAANKYANKMAIAQTDPPADGWMNVENGERVNITAGNRTQLRTQSGTQIHLRTQDNVYLCLNESNKNPAGPLPNQTRNVIRFMNIELNGTTAMNATMFHNFTDADISELGNLSTFRWAYYNEESFEWQYAHENWVEHRPDGAAVLCNTTHFSIWVIIASEEAQPIDKPTPGSLYASKNGTGFAIQAGNKYQVKTQSGFSLQLQLNKSAEVTVTEYEDSPKVMNRERHRIRTQTMRIELNTSAGINATFAYEFTNQIRSQMGVKNMEKLKFMFFNETSNEWEAPKNQWLKGDTLYCNTTHFSLWTVAEDETASSTPSFTLLPLLCTLAAIIAIRKRR
ncbi:MAG: hypothetical protein ACW97Z_14240 [Candidatus Hodarchaeales archaeon]|jgi:hypothetical protein